MTPNDDPGAAAARSADRALRATARHSAGRTAAVFGCSLAAACAALAEPAVLGHCLDLLLRRDPAGTRWALLCAVLTLAEVLLDAATTRLTGSVDARSAAWLRRRGLAALLRTAPDRQSTGVHSSDVVRER
ncbi:ABC transporter ATP-binding protein, partial [Streptomyces sp. NPDC032472]